MPKQVKDLKVFMQYMIDGAAGAKKDAKAGKAKEAPAHKPKTIFKKKLIVKHNKRSIKLKLRTKGQLITYIPENQDNIKKLLSQLPANIEKVEIKPKTQAKKKPAK